MGEMDSLSMQHDTTMGELQGRATIGKKAIEQPLRIAMWWWGWLECAIVLLRFTQPFPQSLATLSHVNKDPTTTKASVCLWITLHTLVYVLFVRYSTEPSRNLPHNLYF